MKSDSSPLRHRGMGLLSASLCLCGLFLFFILSSTALAIDDAELGSLHLHPFDIEAPEKMKVSDDLPLGPGRLVVCNTCHDIESIKDIPLESIERTAPDFLRGGPYSEVTDFCYRCHEKKEYKRHNIHNMLDEKGQLKKDSCEMCHLGIPDPEKVRDKKDVRLRLSRDKLCLGCHLKTPHLNSVNHLKKPPEEMKKIMDASEKRHEIILPLDEEGWITCVTCHSSHEKGVVKEDRPGGRQVAYTTLEKGVAYQESLWNKVFMEDKKIRLKKLEKESGKSLDIKYMQIKEEVLLRLPAKDGTLCLACHEFKR